MRRNTRSNHLERLKTTHFSGSQPGAIFSSRGHLAMSGDIFMVLPDGVAIKNPPDSAGDGIPSVSGEDPLEKEMATHSSILAWRVPGDIFGCHKWGGWVTVLLTSSW